MEPRNYKAGAAGLPPVVPVTPSNGYPKSGDPQTGTLATQVGAFWFYKIGESLRNVILDAGLTPDDNDLTQLLAAINQGKDVPVGSVIVRASNNVPPGFLIMDASELSEVTFADLFADIGHDWDTTGDVAAPAAGYFRLPPSSIEGLGVYFRGVGAVAVGDYEPDALQEHDHVRRESPEGGNSASVYRRGTTDSDTPDTTEGIVDAWAGSTTARVDIETRPRSITMLFCIKY